MYWPAVIWDMSTPCCWKAKETLLSEQGAAQRCTEPPHRHAEILHHALIPLKTCFVSCDWMVLSILTPASHIPPPTASWAVGGLLSGREGGVIRLWTWCLLPQGWTASWHMYHSHPSIYAGTHTHVQLARDIEKGKMKHSSFSCKEKILQHTDSNLQPGTDCGSLPLISIIYLGKAEKPC